MSIEARNAVVAAPVAATPPWRRLSRAIIDRAVSPLFAALLLLYWEFPVRYFAVEALLLPPPSHIAMAFWNGLASGLFLKHFAITVYRALSGFAIASLLGIALGAAISHFRFVEKTVYPWVVALQTVPKIAIAPLILVWCGYGSLSKVARRVLPRARQYHYRPQELRAEQARFDALAARQPMADISSGGAPQCAAFHLCRPERRRGIQHSWCARRRIRWLQGRHRLSHSRCQLPTQHPPRIRTLDL